MERYTFTKWHHANLAVALRDCPEGLEALIKFFKKSNPSFNGERFKEMAQGIPKTPRPKREYVNKHHIPRCEGSYCHSSEGEVRFYSYSEGPEDDKPLLCAGCFQHENWQRHKLAIREGRRAPIVAWETAKRYVCE